MKAEQEHLKRIWANMVKVFINDNVKCHNSLSVEGLMGITLDNELFLVYLNESFTGVIGNVAANCSGEASEGLDVVSDEFNISCSQNDEISTLAGRDVDNGSQCANSSQGIEEEVVKVKPLVILPCWSEEAMQEADCGVSQDETSSTRMTEEQYKIDQSHDVMTTSTFTSVSQHPQLILTSAKLWSEAESVIETAGGLHDGTNNKQRSLVEDRDMVNGDSDRYEIGSAKLKLDEHGMSDDGQSIQSVEGHVCDVCNKVFTHNCYLEHHKLAHGKHTTSKCGNDHRQIGNGHTELNTSSDERSVRGRRICYCDICGLACCSKSPLIIHMRMHTGEKPHACTVCKKAFGYPSSLTSHMRTHTNEKPYACKVCKRAFGCKYSLASHMLTHADDKPYACEVCNKAFRWRGDLTKHVRIHTGEKPYVCKVCKRTFTRYSHVISHMRIHNK